MEVILLEKIKHLGDLGDTVKVRPGYGRNYLVPQGKALPATEENRKVFEARKAELMRKAAESLNAAKMRAEGVEGRTVRIPVRVADEGRLYGSVGPHDIVRAAAAEGIELAKSEVLMPDGPIRRTGSYEITVQLHSEVSARLTVEVVDEAAPQGEPEAQSA